MANNDRFINFIKAHRPAAPVMPMVHTTSVAGLAGIVSSGEIRLSECRFFKEDLVYFFYGKPAYKLRGKTSASSRILGDAAVTFVFDISSLPHPHRMYALDTGAAFGERYDEYLPQGVDIEDFRLHPSTDAPAQVVSAFFQENRRYFLGESKTSTVPPALDVASHAYVDIASSTVSMNFDDRACTCEIQLNQPVSMTNAKLLTVVLPDRAFEDPELKAALKRWKVRPILYRMRRSLAAERTEVIYERLGDYYEARKII